METKFTKGEWKAHKTTVSCGGGIIRQSWGPGGACCEAQRRHSEMVSANASLIAPAPDLNAASETVARWLGPNGDHIATAQMVIDMVEDALKKARGEYGK